MQNKILSKLESFEDKDSGWSLYEILNLKININNYSPIHCGYTSSSYMKMPKFINNSKSVLNIKNNDEYCFLYSIVAALHPAAPNKNPNRTTSYPHFSKILKYDCIEFPINLRDIPKFENMNNLSINIFIVEESGKSSVVPLCLSKTNFTPHVNLLLLQCNEDDANNAIVDYKHIKTRKYFALIQNLSRLLCQQTADKKIKKYFVNAV